MDIIIIDLTLQDVGFPTFGSLDGPNTTNLNSDYSAFYVTLNTNQETLEGSIRVSASTEDKVIRCVAYLHKHFRNIAKMENGYSALIQDPRYGVTTRIKSLSKYLFPGGSTWH